MKKLSSSIVGGIAGAVALNIIHQAVKQFDADAPHVDQVGEEALAKGLTAVGVNPPAGDELFYTTLAADVLSNSFYYSLIGCAKRKHLPLIGAIAGIAAGVGALTLTKPMGLDDAPVNRTQKTQLLTVAWYAIGGLVAGSVMKAFRKKA